MIPEPDCIFCEIIIGEIPSMKLLETDRILAFMDINPFHDGHCLVIPKAHCESLFDSDDEDLAACMKAVRTVATAVNEALQPEGMNIIQSNGIVAGQSVGHFHMHVFPRKAGDAAMMNWRYKPAEMDQLKEVHARILAALW